MLKHPLYQDLVSQMGLSLVCRDILLCEKAADRFSDDASHFNFYPRSEGISNQAVTHQHPERFPPHAMHNVDADYTMALPTHSLARRDATKCLADGTCADKR